MENKKNKKECSHVFRHLDTEIKKIENGWRNWLKITTDRFYCDKCLCIEKRQTREDII